MIGDNMKRAGQGSIIIMAVIGIASLFIAIIGATFAYFSVNLIVEPEKKVNIQSKMLYIKFNSLNNIYYRNVIPGRPSWEEDSEELNKLIFTVTSPTDMLAKNAYDVYLNIDTNNFVSDNMVYYVKQKECVRKDKTGSIKGEMVAYKTLEYDYDGEIVDIGVIPAGFTGKLKVSGGAILGSLGCSDEWLIEIWLNEIGKEQNEDQSKTLRATVEIETGIIYPFDYGIKEDEDKPNPPHNPPEDNPHNPPGDKPHNPPHH